MLSNCYLGFSKFWKFWKFWKIINNKCYFKNFQIKISIFQTPEYMWENHIRCICVQNVKSISWKMTNLWHFEGRLWTYGILRVTIDEIRSLSYWAIFEILFSFSASSILLHWHCCIVVGYHQKFQLLLCHATREAGDAKGKEIQVLSRTDPRCGLMPN